VLDEDRPERLEDLPHRLVKLVLTGVSRPDLLEDRFDPLFHCDCHHFSRKSRQARATDVVTID